MLTIILAKADLGNLELAEKDIEDTLGLGRAESDGLTTEGIAEMEAMAVEIDLPAAVDIADHIARQISDGRQLCRERARVSAD